jgi:hypothetical protein
MLRLFGRAPADKPLLSREAATSAIEVEIERQGWSGFDKRRYALCRHRGRRLWRCSGCLSTEWLSRVFRLRGSEMLVEIDARTGDVVRAVACWSGPVSALPLAYGPEDAGLIPRDDAVKLVEVEIALRNWPRYGVRDCSLWHDRGQLVWSYRSWDLSVSNKYLYFDVDARTGELVTAYRSGESMEPIFVRRRTIFGSA